MKICIITHKFVLTDGQGRVNYKLAEYLARAGHQVTLVSSVIDERLASQPNVTWRKVSVPNWVPTNLLRYQAFALAARKAVLREPEGFDIVHSNGFIAYVVADVNASHFVHSNWLKSPYHGDKSVKSLYHKLYTHLNAQWERSAYQSARKVVAVSDFVRDSLVADCGVNPEKIEVIFNGVDITEFRPLIPGETNQLRTETNVPKEAFLCFFAGDLKTNRKNLDLALQAIKELGDQYHLAVAGDTTGSPYPVMAQTFGVAERVHFLGHRHDLPKLMSGADAFLFASHYDPCPLVAFEALACGTPIITAPTVGNSKMITDGVNGFVLHDSKDLNGMIAVLKRLKNDLQFSISVRLAARATAEQLTWEEMARRYETLYFQVFQEKQSNGASREIKQSTLSPS